MESGIDGTCSELSNRAHPKNHVRKDRSKEVEILDFKKFVEEAVAHLSFSYGKTSKKMYLKAYPTKIGYSSDELNNSPEGERGWEVRKIDKQELTKQRRIKCYTSQKCYDANLHIEFSSSDSNPIGSSWNLESMEHVLNCPTERTLRTMSEKIVPREVEILVTKFVEEAVAHLSFSYGKTSKKVYLKAYPTKIGYSSDGESLYVFESDCQEKQAGY
ncbi:unnamed protein product [Mytilus coruscus]|uniref:Uncharacterized protein n=1 Tax=Mytilus coruscus TaxID=42192 RepID=A0A6J8B644_MYTCO|nr:unnamed protein product [Mytilus coruscus]